MRAVIKLQYDDYNDYKFCESDDYFGDGEYEKALTNELARSSAAANEFTSDLNKGVSRGFLSTDGQFYQIGEKTPQNASKVAYTQCICTLYKHNGEVEDIDGIVSSLVSNKPMLLPLEIDINTMDEEFEVEFISWVREHSSILSYADNNSLGDDWVMNHEPYRDVLLSFENKEGNEVRAVLRDCKILGVVDSNSVVLYSNKHGFE